MSPTLNQPVAQSRWCVARATGVMLLIGWSVLAADKPSASLKPVLLELQPRGMQRGLTNRITLNGSNLTALTEVHFSNTNLRGAILEAGRSNAALVEIWSSSHLPHGSYEVSVANAHGQSAPIKLFVDDVPQFLERDAGGGLDSTSAQTLPSLPVSVWGTLDHPGDVDAYSFEARAGEIVVIDIAARPVGSKMTSGELTVLDSQGRVVAENGGFDGGDPLLTFQPVHSGRFTARIRDRMAAGSKDHFYRLTIGALPYVTGIFPLSLPAHSTGEVQLAGFNLGAEKRGAFRTERNGASLEVKTGEPKEQEVVIDPEQFRTRRTFKIVASALTEANEMEPNDATGTATPMQIPGAMNGRFFSAKNQPDADLFRFHAAAGRKLILETQAAQLGTPADTKLEILDSAGQPVPRLKLQAVRDSFVNFRTIDSNQQGARLENWEEMDLNNFVYLNGEVVRLFRMPQGPDSDLLFYLSSGKRRTYFDTPASGHALEEPCYIVEPRTLDETLSVNGLPVFTLYHVNDDDGSRKGGTDSKLFFTPRQEGDYLVRVSEARGFQGDRFAYRLIVRDAKPDFTAALSISNPSVPRGSGQSFAVTVDRSDGFEGEIRIDITNMPPGFLISTPLLIEAGHDEARGTLFALTNSSSTSNAAIQMQATAMVDGRMVVRKVGSFGQIKVTEPPKLLVALEPFTSLTETNFVEAEEDKPLEITIKPGQMIPAWLKIRRQGHKELVTFQIENLPHGVIVDNIGLNGVLIPKDQNERQIFLTCAKWVQPMDRLCHAIEQNAGKQTSRPLLLKVRAGATQAVAK